MFEEEPLIYEPGTTIASRYRVEGPLSKGAMGAVFRAVELRTGQPVALKVLLDQYLDRDDLVERFRREVEAVGALEHPNILHYRDHGRDDAGRPFLVTELLNGYPGRKLVKQSPPPPLHDVVHVIEQLCSALAVAHSRGIVHRDLKWNNVMITPVAGDPLFAKLIDFGILKYAEEAQGGLKKLTRAGVVLGTPEYTSPEQILGRPLDGRADLYSLGIMTYELLAGRRPFESKVKADLLVMHMRTPPPPLAEAAAGRYEISPALEATVQRALAKKPADRFASVAYFARALAAAVGEGAEEAQPGADAAETAAPGKSRWWWLTKGNK